MLVVESQKIDLKHHQRRVVQVFMHPLGRYEDGLFWRLGAEAQLEQEESEKQLLFHNLCVSAKGSPATEAARGLSLIDQSLSQSVSTVHAR